jgi:hypothetical protein
VRVDDAFQGEAYAVPTEAGDAALLFAARRGGWILDRVYSAKAFSGLLWHAAAGTLPAGDVVFWHTGGQPSVFAPRGAPVELALAGDPPASPQPLHPWTDAIAAPLDRKKRR